MNNGEAKVLVSFNILAQKCAVSDLSALMGHDPDSSIEKGTLVRGTSVPAGNTRWTIEAAGNELDHAESVLARVLDRVRILPLQQIDASTQAACELSICLSMHEGDPSPGIRILPSDLELMAKNNISLEIVTEILCNRDGSGQPRISPRKGASL